MARSRSVCRNRCLQGPRGPQDGPRRELEAISRFAIALLMKTLLRRVSYRLRPHAHNSRKQPQRENNHACRSRIPQLEVYLPGPRKRHCSTICVSAQLGNDVVMKVHREEKLLFPDSEVLKPLDFNAPRLPSARISLKVVRS
jgi:hypothetical protein